MTRRASTLMQQSRRVLVGLVAAVAMSGLAACAAPGSGSSGVAAPHLLPLAQAVTASPDARPPSWPAVLGSKKKIFGVSLTGAPESLDPIANFAKQVHKTPNVVEYYQDWADPFEASRAEHACNAGILPMLTWESWNWQDTENGRTAFSQPAYAPRKIAHGAYDHYIKATARAIKSLSCPIMLRFDQEPNGYWYPWGLGTAGMHNTPAQYVAMWRHVWGIFKHQHVTNVDWSWSPNLLSAVHPYPLRKLYPGNKYVDAIGLDGYLYRTQDTPKSILGPLMKKLKPFASGRPWFVAETGVSSIRQQPSGIKSLLHAVATDKRLHGLVYLDEPEPRADWSLKSAAAVKAFRKAIGKPVYGHAKTLPASGTMG
jgi:hypothetical protein